MRFFHISDLHIGKQLYSYSLGENQREILGEVVEKIKEYHPDALLIRGDIFDRSIPSGEAYSIFDEFLTAVSGIKPEVTVLMIAGNHDSADTGSIFKHEAPPATACKAGTLKYRLIIPESGGLI